MKGRGTRSFKRVSSTSLATATARRAARVAAVSGSSAAARATREELHGVAAMELGEEGLLEGEEVEVGARQLLRAAAAARVAEDLLDQRGRRLAAEVAHEDQRGVLRAVPAVVEGGADLLVEPRAHGLLADREAAREARAVEEVGDALLEELAAGTLARGLFGVDHALLGLDLRRLEPEAVDHVAHPGERLLEARRLVVGQVELVDRLEEGRVGVGVGAEADPLLLEERDELARLEVARAVERHVLEEVGEPQLVAVLVQAADVHVEAQQELLGRVLVLHPDEAQSVLERPELHARVGSEVGGLVLPGPRLGDVARRLLRAGLRRRRAGEESHRRDRHDRTHPRLTTTPAAFRRRRPRPRTRRRCTQRGSPLLHSIVAQKPRAAGFSGSGPGKSAGGWKGSSETTRRQADSAPAASFEASARRAKLR
jgi:hypothetical protein